MEDDYGHLDERDRLRFLSEAGRIASQIGVVILQLPDGRPFVAIRA